MPRLKYSAASKEDLKEIARFIALDKPDAARLWVTRLREKCRLAATHPEIGDDRSDLGDGIRSTYVGSFIIYFREKEGELEIVRIARGDLEYPFL
ncbi:MAG: type II toxin-antitoxin system RelE/ParE family toxin [Planctomycetales bacterium]|nr:type II toxin-antitoxin system RelE/ParE family toxin [Planctomycetales bacterium]MCA9168169.1 type II toxin-antitoxin system RelE/ParE family toxin [Planctomycetales bacterium]